jgi:DNA-binding PadR family transcriptional regulator
MELNEVIILFIINQFHDKISIMDIKKRIRKYQGDSFDIFLSDRNLYNIINTLKRKGFIAIERVKSIPPVVNVSISEQGKMFIEFILKIFSAFIRVSMPQKQSSSLLNNPKGCVKTEADQIDLIDSIVADINANLFNMKATGKNMQDRIRSLAGRIVSKINE